MQGIKELSSAEIEHVSGGGVSSGVRGAIDGAAALAGGGALGYAAAIGAGVGISAFGVGALAVGGAALGVYGVYRLARAFA
ncbi:hypothetical protein GFL91_19150 [Rhizobium leguminosarum bv. viciae]|uniref:Bacteriocin n=1 Tax=Rhizobium leguminosarum bv. viciae TaxID=387 RepID=A0A8I2KK14_RHILV|nr:hypothetical protein [Rhizobium leguminosarum]MBY5793474.1 hypothetical protein [Rhizobium leguminosarum]NKM47055.1 hypothetical protein [Rhizobium leguminosarum bv. viciae]